MIPRETLYAEFIIGASKRLTEAWSHQAESPEVLASLTPPLNGCAEGAVGAIRINLSGTNARHKDVPVMIGAVRARIELDYPRRMRRGGAAASRAAAKSSDECLVRRKAMIPNAESADHSRQRSQRAC